MTLPPNYIDVLGIDPGVKGGIVHLAGVVGQFPKVMMASRLPVMQDRAKEYVSGGSQSVIDVINAAKLVNTTWEFCLRKGRDPTCIIERAQAMPKQGVVSCFNYGTNFGMIVAIARIFFGDERVFTVRPGVWKKDFGLAGGDKESARSFATKMLGTDEPWKFKRDEGVAEAALIALWRLNRCAKRQRQKMI